MPSIRECSLKVQQSALCAHEKISSSILHVSIYSSHMGQLEDLMHRCHVRRDYTGPLEAFFKPNSLASMLYPIPAIPPFRAAGWNMEPNLRGAPIVAEGRGSPVHATRVIAFMSKKERRQAKADPRRGTRVGFP